MKKILFFLLAASYMIASNLLTYNIYDRSDRVDFMLSFDSPYDGQIYQKKQDNSTILKLDDLNYNKIIKKDINSKILQKLSIIPSNNFTKIVLKSKKPIVVIASKTTDGFGLRIRAKSVISQKKNSKLATYDSLKNKNSNTIYKNEDSLDTRYITVVIILLVFLVLMFWIRKKLSKKNNFLKNNSWLFKNSDISNKDIKILHKKQIDPSNSVVLLEFGNIKYLVMSGNSNLLLDTFGKEDIENKSDFEKAFEENRQKLDDYLKIQDQKLEDYKKKASNDFEKDLDFYK